ncbi:MAG: hypothetical protein ABFD98_09085 [Syntrophobacteraceae bacterium]|nr:hypothetical protein [Desulfobacteraceae bacterium]
MADRHSPIERDERGAIEILESAVLLLRTAPPRCLLYYCAGTMPFVLGLIFFLTDMSCGAAARSRLIGESLATALLFLWMKCWQAVFAGSLYDRLSGAQPPSWNFRRIARLLCVQSAVMPWQFAVLPIALLITLPFGWCYAFFQNLSVTGDGRESLAESIRSAWRHAKLWPWQNHKMLLVLCPFGLFVLLNISAALYMLPGLLKILFGMETVFSRSGYSFVNSTSLLSVVGLGYLCLNPLIKAAYAQRCFLGASIFTGQDLLLELKRIRGVKTLRRMLPVAVLLPGLMAQNVFATAQNTSPSGVERPSSRRTVSPEELERAIGKVIGGLEYSWRMPDPKRQDHEESGFWKQVSDAVSGVFRKIGDALKSFFKWLEEFLDNLLGHKDDPKPERKGIGKIPLWLNLLLLTVVVLCGVFLVLALKRKRTACRQDTGGTDPTVPPDLADENLMAGDLPVARWLALARQLTANGELRLALRAFYFAGLAHLSERQFLTIAPFKSNREYETELRRRAHAFPSLIESFSENVAILERVWYGRHEVLQDTFHRFSTNHKRILSDAENRQN